MNTKDLKMALMTTGSIGEDPDQKMVVYAITNAEFDQRKYPQRFGPFEDYLVAKEEMEKHFSNYDHAYWDMPSSFWRLMMGVGIGKEAPEDMAKEELNVYQVGKMLSEEE